MSAPQRDRGLVDLTSSTLQHLSPNLFHVLCCHPHLCNSLVYIGSQDQSVVWNFPIDVTFKATNAFGWPRLALSVYGVDGMGCDVVRGYGSLLLPTSPGTHIKHVHMYRPINSSILQRFMAWVTGTHPEVSLRLCTI